MRVCEATHLAVVSVGVACSGPCAVCGAVGNTGWQHAPIQQEQPVCGSEMGQGLVPLYPAPPAPTPTAASLQSSSSWPSYRQLLLVSAVQAVLAQLSSAATCVRCACMATWAIGGQSSSLPILRLDADFSWPATGRNLTAATNRLLESCLGLHVQRPLHVHDGDATLGPLCRECCRWHLPSDNN